MSIAVNAAQNPVAQRRASTSMLSCTAACDQAAYAAGQRAGHALASPTTPSRTSSSATAGAWRSLFTPGQLLKLRAALRANQPDHRRLVGAVVDAGGNIESHTQTLTLRFAG